MPSLVRVGVVSGTTSRSRSTRPSPRAGEQHEIEVADRRRLAESQTARPARRLRPAADLPPEINNSCGPSSKHLRRADAAGTVATTDIKQRLLRHQQFGRAAATTPTSSTTRARRPRPATTRSTRSTRRARASSSRSRSGATAHRRNRQQIRIQQKRLEQSDADFRRRTIEVIAQVQRAYWDLVFALRDEQNQIANLNLARENFRRTEASVAAGATAPLERAEIQTELSNRESALLLSSQNVSIAENNLKNLIIKEPFSAEWSRVIVPTDQARFDDTPVSLETAMKEARDNRPELRRLRLQQDINDIDLQFFRNQTKPQIDLTGTVSTTGLAGTPSATGGTRIVDLIGGDEVAGTDSDAFLLQSINRTRRDLGLDPITPPQVTVGGEGVPSQFQGGYFQTLRNLFSCSTRNIVVG